MTTHKMTITAGGMAHCLIMFMEGDNAENQRFAREQILALCQFYEDNKPDDEITQQEADELMDLDPRETPEEHMDEEEQA